ncbi:MAG: aspartate aminotransferase, partial [Bacteroidota bacterium]
MEYKRMPIEKESPEELGYGNIECNLAESSVSDFILKDIQLNIRDLSLCYTDHKGKPELRELIVAGYDTLDKENVLLTVGAASALFIIAS